MPDTVIQLKTALAYYEAGQLEAAAALCESVLRENPEDRERLFALYAADLEARHARYAIVRGQGDERLTSALSACQNWLSL